MVDVTLLLPVYNGERYLRETLQSLLSQTYTDFELLIVDDGSTDSSADIIRRFADPRIRLLKNPERLKLSGALNRGMKEAKGRYIARMDADDIALPRRLQQQFAYMEAHPEVGMCGTAIEIFGKDHPRRDVYPATSDAIRAYGLFDCPFCHPSVMMRKGMFFQYDLWYDGEYYPTEDYELWARAIELFPTVNLDEVLLRYRIHESSMTGSDWDAMDKQAARVALPLLHNLGVLPSKTELRLHRNIGRGRSCQLRDMEEVEQAEQWLKRLITANQQRECYNPVALARTIALIWFRVCMNSSSLGFVLLSKYATSSLRKRDEKSISNLLTLLASVVKQQLVRKTT
ncbi:MAG: glycosyltransferase [Candidatus Electrothrix sp. GW3-4]|uniref:glycosyltransferase family 2 protein n=1 Tax=Candidatus Electrothrix sp. GW3-4 TaxID=3126740 RepID=UPI0030CE948A